MRFEKGHKENTHKRILDTASKRFRRDGLSASGLAAIMADAGLTNGAFYPHFSSKDELFREALKTALVDQRVKLEQDGVQGRTFEESIRRYLNAEHLAHSDEGCPSAALLPEIARHASDTRGAYEEELRAYVGTLSKRLPGGKKDSASLRTATAIIGLLVGTLQLARVVPDRKLAEDILEGGVQAALSLAAASGPSAGSPAKTPTSKARPAVKRARSPK